MYFVSLQLLHTYLAQPLSYSPAAVTMQLASIKRLLGMDDVSHESNNGEILTDGSLEKGPTPIREVEDESNYPPFRTVVLSMTAIYFAFFLSALVGLIIGFGDC